MKKWLLVLFLYIVIYPLLAQRIIKPDIQFVTLTDTFLIRQIHALIEEEKKADTLFAKGYGYITMGYSYGKRFREYNSMNDFLKDDKPRKDTVFRYMLGTSFMSMDPKENTLGDMYPTYYSSVGGRLIFIDDGTAKYYFGFSEKSKERLRKKLEPFLEKPGSKSRAYINLKRQKHIYYLRDILNESVPSERIVVNKIY